MSDSDNRSELLSRLVLTEDDQQAQGSSFLQSPWFVGALALIIGLVAGYIIFNGTEAESVTAKTGTQSAPAQSNASANVNAQEDKIERVLSVPGSEILNASGYVTPRLMATVSAEVMGLIKSVEVEEGMIVETGQVLAHLDDAVARVNWELATAQYESQVARLEGMRSEYDEAVRVLNRQLELKKQKLTSEAEITRTQSNVDRIAASIRSVEADNRVAKLQAQRQKETLDDHTVRAPFSGVVTVKNAQPGEIIAPSSAGGGFTRTGICTIVDMDSLEIEVDVNEAFIGRVFPDQKVVANLDAYPKWDIPASVIAVIPTADRSKATVQVRIKIMEKDLRILPDMGVKVAFFSKGPSD